MPKQQSSKTESLNTNEIGRKVLAALTGEGLGVDLATKYVGDPPPSWNEFAVDVVLHGVRERGITVGPFYPWYEAGRRLYAVAITRQMGLSRVDNVLRRYTPTTIDQAWADFAGVALEHLYNPTGDPHHPVVPQSKRECPLNYLLNGSIDLWVEAEKTNFNPQQLTQHLTSLGVEEHAAESFAEFICDEHNGRESPWSDVMLFAWRNHVKVQRCWRPGYYPRPNWVN